MKNPLKYIITLFKKAFNDELTSKEALILSIILGLFMGALYSSITLLDPRLFIR